METHKIAKLIILLLSLGTFLLTSLACPSCQNPTTPQPTPPEIKPPVGKPPTMVKPPTLHPPVITVPPVVPKPYPYPPSPKHPYPSPLPPKHPYPPPPSKTCSIDTSKLDKCVDVLDGAGSGESMNKACCPVVEGLLDLDAAICLCVAIKAKVLNIDILLDLVLKVLLGCGKSPPSGFQCLA